MITAALPTSWRGSVCLVAAATMLAAIPVAGAAQTAPSAETSRHAKSPPLAAVLSFVITGAGQVYAGKPLDGLGLLTAGVGAVVLGQRMATCDAPQGAGGTVSCQRFPLYAGIGVAATMWIYSITTAPRDVAEWNERHGLTRASVVPLFDPQPGRTRVGLGLRW